jgi:isoleucyl-tRNA synthetase
MCRWLAPILSFTAEVIWSHLPGEHDDSPLLHTWYGQLFALQDGEAMNMAFWQRVLQARSAVSRQLEVLRKDNRIGSSLDAEVTLYCDDRLLPVLQALGDELRFVFITSEATAVPLAEAPADSVDAALDDAEMKIHADKSPHAKCVRCWHHRADVGSNAEHPELCGRCVQNVAGDGEQRRFA